MANFDPFEAGAIALEEPPKLAAFDPFEAGAIEELPVPDSSALRRYVGDPALSLAKGVVGLPEALVGIADIPTLGYAGKILEAGGYGFQPKVTKAWFDSLKSPEQKAADERVQKTKGFLPTIGAMVKDPSTIVDTTLESVPSMIGGAGIARTGLSLLPKLTPAAAAAGGALRRAIVAGAAGEGAIGAGMAAEQTRQSNESGLLTPKQAALSVTSGAGTALISVIGGRLAKRLGVTDVDTLLAGGGVTTAAAKKSILRRIAESALTEGAFEELPQSAQEQWQSNLAMGRPPGEGVAEAAATGLLAGLVMGGFGGLAGGGKPPPREDVEPTIAREIEPASTPEFFRQPTETAVPPTSAATVTPTPIERTPVQRARLAATGARILIGRGVDTETANGFANWFVENSTHGTVGEEFRSDLNKAFESSGFADESANSYSDETNLRAAAAANGFTEAEIQAGIEKRAARKAEIDAQNRVTLERVTGRKVPTTIPQVNAQPTDTTAATPEKKTVPLPPVKPVSPEPTLESVSNQSAAQFFDTAAEWARAAVASEPGALGPQLRAESAARANPDLAAWQKAYDQAAAEAERIKREIQQAPDTMMARQKEMMGAAQKASFFSEGLKVLRAVAPAETTPPTPAATVAPVAEPEPKPEVPPPPPKKPTAAPPVAPVEDRSREELIRKERVDAIASLDEQLKDIKNRRKAVRSEFKGVKPISPMNRTTPNIERGQKFQSALNALEVEENDVGRQWAKLKKEQSEEAPLPPTETAGHAASLTANTGGMSQSTAKPVIDAWRKANPNAPEVETVNRPKWTQTGSDGKQYGVRGWWDGQKIIVNLAFVAEADAVREVLEHELIHPLLDSAQGEAAITSAIEQELGGDALATIQTRYKQGANESPESYRRRTMAEWFAQLKESNQSLWQRIVARVREFLAQFKLANLTDDEIVRAMLRKLEREAGQQSDALAEQPGSASLTQEPVGEDDDTKKQRIFGADIGQSQNIERIAEIQAALKDNGYLIGDTVTPENTQAAWEQFASFVDPAKRADTISQLRAAVPQEMAPGIVHSTLWQYAVRMTAAGDPSLFRAMTANSNQFQLWDGPAFRSTFGRGLRALRLGADFTTWKNELIRTKAQREAIAKELGIDPKDINLLDLLIVNLNGATPDADELAKAAAKLIGNQAKERDLTADELYVLMSKLIFPVGTTGIEIKPAPKVLQRIAAMFPTAGIREMFEKQGASGLARDLWQLLAGPQKPAGPLWTAQAAIRGQLGQILKEAMQRAGIEQANRPPTITSEEKLAKFLGDKETRQNIVARVDEEVRSEMEQRQAEEIEAAGDNETLVESIEQKYAQLEDAWRDATSSMLVDTGSEALLGRMVRARLKTLNPDWSLIFNGKRSLADVRSAVIDGITEDVLRVANQGRTPDWLSDAQVGFGEMFDRVASLEKNRYEMNLLAKRAQEQLRLTGKPEQQADALLSQFAREQSDTPSDQRAFAKNEVREAFNGYLSGDITADEFRATLSSINVSGAKIGSLLGVANRELASRKLIAQLREQERIERAKEREIKKLKEQGNVTAAAMLKRLQQDYAGVDWIKPATVNAVQQILRDHYKGSEPILPILGNTNRVIDALAKRFTDEAGVSPDIAQQLANAAEVKRQSDWTNARNRAIQRAKNSGSLRGLIDEILATPYLAQANPEWVRTTAINWFLANGLSREQAEGATAIFQREFAAKLLEAQIKVAERLLEKAPPKNLREFIEALRAGLLDPDKPWLDAYAKKAGWNVPTRAQFQRLAELEMKLQDQNLGASERAEATEAMMGIYLHLKLPPSLMQRIAANFVVTALTGIRTMTVNLFAPLERLMTETTLRTVTRPQDLGRNIQTLFGAYAKNWAALRRLKFSLHKDAFTFLNNEFEQATNEQRRLWEEAQADFASGDKVRQTKALVKGLYGSQQFAMRLLNAADQANAMAEREVQLLNYGSAAFREAGMGTQAVTALVQAASRLKQAAYETAIQQGRSPDQAQIDADEVAIEQLEDFIGKELANAGDPDANTKARQMLEAATKDAYSAIGRLVPGIEETDEGGIFSRLIYHNILRASNALRGGKGADPILGVSLLGYVSIPFRTGRHMLWNGPYGLLRLGIHHFRKGRPGFDNQWKQTLANEYQERQRLKLALAGTAAWAMIGTLGFALLGKSGDDDAGEEDDFGFYVTGRGPKSKNLRDAWMKSGFRENSLVAFIFGKPIAIPMTRVGEPLGHLFWMLSARDDYGWRKREAEAAGKEFKETWTATTGRAMGTYLGMISQRGLLQNIAQWGKLGSGEGGTDKVLSDLASKTLAGAVLPWLGMQRSLIGMTEGPLDRSSIESAMAANFGIPGLYWNKQGVNRFGDPLGNRTWFGKLADTGVPLAFQVEETSENQKFYRTLAQKGASPPELRRYVLEEKYGPLSDDQFADFARRSGTLLKRAVSQNLSGLEAMTPKQVKDYMSKVATQADRTAAAALGLVAEKAPTRSVAAIEPEAVPLLPAPRRLASGRVRAAVGRSRGLGRTRSLVGRSRSRLATMRVPRLRTGMVRGLMGRRGGYRRPRRVRSAMTRIRRPRLSYA